MWFLLFVILGVGPETAFIAGGSVIAAGVLAAAMVAGGRVFDAPLTTAGLLLGIAMFVILKVVLSSIPMWVSVVSGLGMIGLYSLVDAGGRGRLTAFRRRHHPKRQRAYRLRAGWCRVSDTAGSPELLVDYGE